MPADDQHPDPDRLSEESAGPPPAVGEWPEGDWAVDPEAPSVAFIEPLNVAQFDYNLDAPEPGWSGPWASGSDALP